MQSTMTTSDEDLLSMSFESLRLATNHSGSSNEVPYGYNPYNYGFHPNSGSSSYSGYEPSHYPPQMPFQEPFNTWVHAQFPLHGVTVGRDRQCYQSHVNNFIHNYANSMSWYQYCLFQDRNPSNFEPARTSFWY